MNKRLFIKINRDNLVRIKDKYPFIYLERGRLEVDDSSVKWISADGEVIKIPIATINCVLLGPGTSITHEAIKVVSATNCVLCWVGEDSFLFYAVGSKPTSNTRNLKKQISLATDAEQALNIAKKMFSYRYPEEEIKDKSLQEIMGMEGRRVRSLYQTMAVKYGVEWGGRSYQPNNFNFSNTTNKILTACNAALYGIITSVVYGMGYSPHIGFIHSGSPLPFVYDIADLYKDRLSIEIAFKLSKDLDNIYDKHRVLEEFRLRLIESKILDKMVEDIQSILKEQP